MRIYAIIALAFACLNLSAGEKYPMAIMKASYDYDYALTYRDGKNDWKHAVMILQIAPEQSRFYSYKTEFLDSLIATESGRKIYHQMISDAIARGNGDVASINMPCKDVHTQVNKYFDKGEMRVIEFANMNDYFYMEPLNELTWTIGDSVKTILGYECQKAEADYHGRHWIAWFAPEVPVQDGPWKLYGLPGLIMEAYCGSREHIFSITGLQKVSEPITPKPGKPVLEKTERIPFLKEKRESWGGAGKELEALLRSMDPDVTINSTSNTKPTSTFHDYLETDYWK